MTASHLREAELDALMARLASGDRRAFDPLYEALRARAMRLVARRVPVSTAPDIVQSAMLKVFARASEFTPGRPCLPWFYAVVANELRAAVRKEARLLVVEDLPEVPVESEDAEAELARRELERALEIAIDSLDDEAGNAIRSLLGRAPVPPVADATFRKRVSRAYAKLRVMLGATMQADRSAYLQARQAYELGRLRVSFFRAMMVVLPVAVVGVAVAGRSAALWLPITFCGWLFAHWRGGPLLRGSYVGLLGGIVTFALPMTILRPCCSPEAMTQGMDCCTQPSACITAGVFLGIALAAFLPSSSARWRTAGGVLIGVASVAVLRCSTLFAAEAFGLVGGLAAGILVTTVGRVLIASRAGVER